MKKILYALLLTLTCPAMVAAQDFNYTKAQIDIANNNDFSSFYLLDTAIGRYNVFFSGENHMFRASNAKLELKLLQYLHKNAGVKHLLLEFGYTSGYLVDQYVNFNDSAAYNILKVYFSETYLWMFKGIKDYNATLDSSKKVRVHGIDFEDDMLFSVRTIAKILPDKDAPDEIGLQIETLRNMDLRYTKNGTYANRSSSIFYYGTGLGTGIYQNVYNADSTMRDVVVNFERYRDVYDTYFGKDAAAFAAIMEHVHYYLEWRELINTSKMQERPYRERYMYKNFMSLMEKNPGEKFFGQFGRCHTSTNRTDIDCDVNYYNSLVGKINTHPNEYLKNKVCVIAGIYPKIEFNTLKLNSYHILQKLKKAAADTGITLFPVLNDTLNFGELSKHYKYIFINNNSPARENNINNTTPSSSKRKFFDRANSVDMFFGFAYHLQFSGIKTTKLQPFYDQYKLTAPASPLLLQGISFEVLDDLMGNYFNAGYAWLPGAEIRTSDTSVFTLTAAFVHMRGGYDVNDMAPLFNCIPYFGFAYNELRIRHVIDNSDQLFQTETVPAEITYRNPAILFDFGLHLSTRIYFMGLTAYGGYQLDLSSKNGVKTARILRPHPTCHWEVGMPV